MIFEFIETLLTIMPLIYWCGLLLIELIIIFNIFLASKDKSIANDVIILVLSIASLLYIGYVVFFTKTLFTISFIFIFSAILFSLVVISDIYYFTKPISVPAFVDYKKGYYAQYKTDDYKYTFGILDPRKKVVIMSCLKYENIFIFNELVRQTRFAIKEALIEDQTTKYTFKQTYPKFVIFKENNLYYFDLYLNERVVTIESNGFDNINKALKEIYKIRDYGRTVMNLIVRDSIDGSKLSDYEDNYVEKVKSLPKEKKVIEHKKANASTQLSIFDVFDQEEDNKEQKTEETLFEEVKEEEKVEPKVIKPKKEPKEVNEDKSEKESLSKSFEAKLYLNTTDNKEYYSKVKNEILSYEGVYSKISFKHETFKYDGKLIMKMQIRGTKVAILCPFTQEEYQNSKFKFVDVDNFDSHEETPLLYKVYNPLRLKYATQIIEGVMEKYNISKKENPEYVDYAKDFNGKDVDQLIQEGLIRKQ